MKQLLIILVCVTYCAYQISSESAPKIAKAVIESCSGCALNRLVEVKNFVYKDVHKYDNVEFVKIHGAHPELVLLNEQDKEIERIDLAPLTRQQCNELLVEKGFSLRENDKLEL